VMLLAVHPRSSASDGRKGVIFKRPGEISIMSKRSRLSKKFRSSRFARIPQSAFVMRLRRNVPATSIAELGFGIGGTAAGLVIPPAGAILIPAGALLTVSGVRDLRSEVSSQKKRRAGQDAGVYA
jgi:hypothetical protein